MNGVNVSDEIRNFRSDWLKWLLSLTDCSWSIGAGQSGSVLLTAEAFWLEAAQGCTFDYVEVSISTLSDAPERYCGRQPRWFGNDGSIEAQGSVQIIFHSDSGEEFPGFRIRYQISSGLIDQSTIGIIYKLRRPVFSVQWTRD